MKDNKLDNLFKDKLRDLEKSPRPLAWDRISSGIKKEESRPKIIWWQKAAIIVILCLSGFLIFYKMDRVGANQRKAVSVLERSEKTTLGNAEKDDDAAQNIGSTAKEVADDERSPSKSEQIDPLASKGKKHLDKTKRKTEKLEIKQYAMESFPSTGSEGGTQNDKHYGEAIVTNIFENPETDKGVKSTPSITIEFKSGKKGQQKTLVAENTASESNEDQTFTLKKLIAKVKDVKEGELGLAELRQAKDELFAFDTFEINKPTEK